MVDVASALHELRTEVDRDHVLQAVKEYDRLGPDDFFATHGYGPSRSYELVLDGHRYPHKAILGTAYVAVLEGLGFAVEPKG